MHLRDADLKRILQSETDDAIAKKTESHLDTCSTCRERLAQLSGDTDDSIVNAIPHLRSADESDLECTTGSTNVTIELSSLLAMDSAAEVEQVDLDFLDAPVHPELLGRLDRYDVERVVGSGGMGVVLKAHDGELNRVVAIKVLAPHLAGSGAARRRFSREARAAAAVLHPNVLPIFNVESEGKLPYFVMQFVAGQSLQARVDREGPLEIPMALRIARQTASALAAAHAQGLVHRDVKPANILLEEDVDRAQLTDFGLARTSDDASLTRTGIVAGTPHYMSPEQANGDAIDARSDLFSLGCTLYFMLAARPPFRAESPMAVLNRICHHPHRPLYTVNNSVPRELSQLVDRLLAKRASKRFESAAVVESELDRMLAAVQEGRIRIHSSASRGPLYHLTRALSVASLVIATILATYHFWPTRVQQQEPTFTPQPASNFSDDDSGRSDIASHYSSSVKSDDSRTGSPVVGNPSEPQWNPLRLIEAEDQWKRELNELNARVLATSTTDYSWFSILAVANDAADMELQSLQTRLREISNPSQPIVPTIPSSLLPTLPQQPSRY